MYNKLIINNHQDLFGESQLPKSLLFTFDINASRRTLTIFCFPLREINSKGAMEVLKIVTNISIKEKNHYH